MKTQLECLVEAWKIRVVSQSHKVKNIPPTMKDMVPYRVTLAHGRHRLTVDYFMGTGLKDGPQAADIIYSLCSDVGAGEQDFEDFCSEFGYDSDSRSAHATWRKCRAISPRIRRFLGEHFEEASRAEH